MAGKGQKFKKYPDEIKLEIASKAREGRGYRSIGREYPNIPAKTIENWVRKAKNSIDVTKDGRGGLGRPKSKNLTLEDYKERYEILKNTRPSYKHDEGKSNVYNYSYKRIQTI